MVCRGEGPLGEHNSLTVEWAIKMRWVRWWFYTVIELGVGIWSSVEPVVWRDQWLSGMGWGRLARWVRPWSIQSQGWDRFHLDWNTLSHARVTQSSAPQMNIEFHQSQVLSLFRLDRAEVLQAKREARKEDCQRRVACEGTSHRSTYSEL